MHPRRNDHVALLAYDGVTMLEYAIGAEVFGLPRPELDAFYSFDVVAVEPGVLRGSYGVQVHATAGLADLSEAGTIVVPGWRDRHERPPTPLLDALAEAHDRGARLVSVCSGAFVLAAAGLLDGRRATTHWAYAADLAAAAPAALVDADVLYADEGSVLTSAGSAAGIDACLHLVREDWGAAAAATVARRMVVSPHRAGGQAQHVAAPLATNTTGDLAALLEDVERTLDRPHTVATLAAAMHVGPRTFVRRFEAATGTSPGRWLVDRRMSRARELLESGDQAVEEIARAVGFGSAVSLRHHFRSRLQTSPTAYRLAYAR